MAKVKVVKKSVETPAVVPQPVATTTAPLPFTLPVPAALLPETPAGKDWFGHRVDATGRTHRMHQCFVIAAARGISLSTDQLVRIVNGDGYVSHSQRSASSAASIGSHLRSLSGHGGVYRELAVIESVGRGTWQLTARGRELAAATIAALQTADKPAGSKRSKK